MQRDNLHSTSDEPVILHHWSARTLRPVIMLYVALVFVAFMVLAFFVFHSTVALKALATAAVGTIVSVFVGVVSKIEYQLTDSGLEKRPLNLRSPRPFKIVFRWGQLSHIVPTRHGFKYYKPLDEPNPLRRFWKTHVSDAFSGEVDIEAEDRDTVLGIMAQRGVRPRKPDQRLP